MHSFPGHHYGSGCMVGVCGPTNRESPAEKCGGSYSVSMAFSAFVYIGKRVFITPVHTMPLICPVYQEIHVESHSFLQLNVRIISLVGQEGLETLYSQSVDGYLKTSLLKIAKDSISL